MLLSSITSKGAETLCQRCLRLTFDNSAIVDAPPPQQYEGRDDLDLDEYRIIPLDFTLKDELPDLPELERSGANHCHMCLFLKKVILTQLQLLPIEQTYAGSITLQLNEFHPDLATVQFANSRDDWLPNRITGELRLGAEIYPIDIFVKHRADAKVVFDARTVLANLPERLKGFRTDTVPQTLQDSIALAHRLGASHIWIDALCIVQDSGEWIYESVRMMQYYEMAQFTIVPIDSSGAEKGFLRNRPPWAEDVIQWKGSLSHLQFFFPSFNKVEDAGPATSSPWASRGWTFQERLLSSRLVFIGRDEVMFRCRAGWGKHASRTPIILESLGSYFLPLSPTYAAYSNDWNSVEMIRDKWYQILGEYSQRSLTKQSDKLVALSASVDDTKLVEVVRQGTSTDGKVKKLIVEGWVFSIRLLDVPPDDLEVDFYLDSLSDTSTDLIKQDAARVILLKAYLDGDDKEEWLKEPAAKPHDVCGLIIESTGDSYKGHAVYRRLGIVDILPGWDFTFSSSETTAGSSFYQGMYTKKETAVLV
ncbi:hypothetical protein N0V84_000384 [Fusarium piperis]|uniref:Heterokaryon incompatibility domain-containing protein n=1 Tax=Fusarium piperis TaxID=1435070 RepID=A0A9W8WMN7_9HYPO|nr:hypothetical protein N0V84_000384 [Fusarium piperis]